MVKNFPIKKMLDDMARYPGIDNRGLCDVHYKGALLGYSHGGARARKVFYPGMNPRIKCAEIPGVTKTWNVLPPAIVEKEKREFQRWISGMEWYEEWMRVMVTDDYRFNRIEYRVILR